MINRYFYVVEGKPRERWYYCSMDCARKSWVDIDDVDIEHTDIEYELELSRGLPLGDLKCDKCKKPL